MKSKSPFFFLIVDDGGFFSTEPEDGYAIDFSAYRNLVRLALEFDIQIGLACTSRYFDINGISESPNTHKDTQRIIDLLEKYRDRIIIADHGYDHVFGEGYCEFYDYKGRVKRPIHEQEKHIDQSIAIYRSIGWAAPELFVPPAHGWEPGITDRLYAERGLKYLSSYLWLKHPLKNAKELTPAALVRFFKPAFTYPERSNYLEILPRLGFGISSKCLRINRITWEKAFLSVFPTNRVYSLLFHRRKIVQPHNYKAHLANFSGETNFHGWRILLDRIAKQKATLAGSFKESIKLWHQHSYQETIKPSISGR
jgi:hypothetical protein